MGGLWVESAPKKKMIKGTGPGAEVAPTFFLSPSLSNPPTPTVHRPPPPARLYTCHALSPLAYFLPFTNIFRNLCTRAQLTREWSRGKILLSRADIYAPHDHLRWGETRWRRTAPRLAAPMRASLVGSVGVSVQVCDVCVAAVKK